MQQQEPYYRQIHEREKPSLRVTSAKLRLLFHLLFILFIVHFSSPSN
ncbi:hypothetical protein KKH3_28980 [Pectobacterium actinidiae]|nr:hypothetical protein KKH3_28980 [Pectobacterium actinidiae]